MFFANIKSCYKQQYLADKKSIKVQMTDSLFYYFMQALVFDFLQFVQAA